MIVSDKHSFVFLRMPRTASLSISRHLCAAYEGREPLGDEGYHQFRCPDAFVTYEHFAVIRHPLARFVSMYNHAVALHFWTHSFAETVNLAASGDNWMFKLPLYGDWWLPQITLLAMAQREVHLLRFETLAEDFAALRCVDACPEAVRASLPVSHDHKGRYSAAAYYTPELADKVCAVYARDFIAFPGYAQSVLQMHEPCPPPPPATPANG
jgi:hypothetical protein